MTAPLTSVFPRPIQSDADDVRWTLQTAAVQWQRGLHAEAIVWVRRAADSAIGCGHPSRGDALREQASFLAGLLWPESDGAATAASSAPPMTVEPDTFEPSESDPEEIELLDADVEELTAEELAFLDDSAVQSELASAPLDIRSDSEALAAPSPHSTLTRPPPAQPMMSSIVSSAPEVGSSPAAEGAPAPDLGLGSAPDRASMAERVGRALRAPSVPRSLTDPASGRDTFVSPGGGAGAARATIESGPPTAPQVGAGEGSPGRLGAPMRAALSPSNAPERAGPAAATAATAELGAAFDDVTELSDAAGAAYDPTTEARKTLLDDPAPAVLSRASEAGAEDTVEASPELLGRPTEPGGLSESGAVSSSQRAGRSWFDEAADATELSVPGLEPAGLGALSTVPALQAESLAAVEVLADLPTETHAELAACGNLVPLGPGKGLMLASGVGAVVRGSVGVCHDEAAQPGIRVGDGAVIATKGILGPAPSLYLRAGKRGAHLALWLPEQLAGALSASPWVGDELRRNADRLRALAGAASGALGRQLDESLLAGVLERFEVRPLQAGHVVAQAGKPVEGLFLVGGGSLAASPSGELRSVRRWAPGEFVLGQSLVDGSAAVYDVAVEARGALLMFAPRAVAHELMMSLPPLIEILAS